MGDEPEVVVEAPESETEITDESVNVTVVNMPEPEPEVTPEPPAVQAVEDARFAEHEDRLSKLEAFQAELVAELAEVTAAVEEEIQAEPEVLPEPAPEPEATPDVAPKRTHPLHFKLFSRHED